MALLGGEGTAGVDQRTGHMGGEDGILVCRNFDAHTTGVDQRTGHMGGKDGILVCRDDQT